MKLASLPARRVRNLSLAALAVAAACSTPLLSTESSSAAPRPSSPSSPSPSSPSINGRTVLTANVHPLARPENDLGPVAPAMPLSSISFVIKPSPAQLADRDALLASIQDPTSPTYHQWLTPEQYAVRFGVTPQALARMTAWLESQGFTVTGPSRTGTQVFFSGTAGQVATAFDAELHHYSVLGETHTALSRGPTVPSDIAAGVHGLHGLNDFRKHAPRIQHKPHPLYDAGDAYQNALSFAPADYATIYDLNPLYTAGIDGTGQSIVIVGQSDVIDGDVAAFRTLFSLPATAPAFTKVLVPGSGALAISQGDIDESELDLEWSGAVAKNAQIIFVTTGDSPLSNGVDDSLAYAINQNLAPVMSESYGGCDVGEPANANLDGEVASAANLLGITVLAASGDSGAAGCLPELGGLAVGPPADFPGVVAVGGTEFPPSAQVPPYFNTSNAAVEYPAPGGVTLETTWNDSMVPAIGSQTSGGASASGGGPSSIFPKPFWQVGVTPNDTFRDIPDVSLSASPNNLPYLVYDTSQSAGGGTLDDGGTDPLVPIGGTSCATPSFAGMIALVNHQLFKKNGAAPGLGNANPELYALAKSAPAAFHDITTGNNDVPCTPGTDPTCPKSGTYGGFSAGVGYDEATGLGSVDADKLVTAWAALNPTTTALQLSATTAGLGASITLSATIGSAATTPAMTGSVSFTFVTYLAGDGGADDSWVLGSTPVTATTTGGKQGATATLTTAIPPGVNGQVDVVAMYNGDADYLWSQSVRSRVTVTGLTLAISPAAGAVAPNGTLTLTATGGVAPLTWQVVRDSTYDQTTFAGATITPATGAAATTAVYQAGDTAGESVVQVVDADGQDAYVTITVATAAADAGPPAEAGAPIDAGAPTDSGPVETTDAGGPGAPPASGCSCIAAGSAPPRGTQAGALGGILLGLAAFGRRRRSRR